MFIVLIKLAPVNSLERFKSVRVGFVVSKKVLKKAVERNRFKRVLKSAIRDSGLKGCDLVLIAKGNFSLTLHNPIFFWKNLHTMKKLASWVHIKLKEQNVS